ncbi:MAG: Transcription termination/antitermination protein NusA [Eubacteriales bacterium SKADARSKE-1]|nr:Transcription termination/antitermination protein NusA [Eubacteriales bacterium SKADARSKE-1]
MNNKEIFGALFLLEKERGISVQFMLDKIRKAILTACKNSYNGNDDAIINIDEKKNKFEVFLRKTVVDEVIDTGKEISFYEARKIDPNVALDEKVSVKLDTKEFGRIAAQTARNIIRQGIKDGERDLMLQEFESHRQQIVSAIIEKVDPKNGSATIRIGKAEAYLPKNEQLVNDKLKEGSHIKVYIVDVKEGDRGPKVVLSRTHPDVVKKMFETEVPEIQEKVVEIKQVSREAGSRTKLAVLSHDENVDAIGACVGSRGARVNAIVDELGGEKIDIIEYNEDPVKFISAALSPAEVLNVEIISEELKSCKVTVPDNQLSLAIGNRGQNARLAAKLTGWKIDIKPESEIKKETEL